MNRECSIFAQMLSLIAPTGFEKAVAKHRI